MKAMEHLETYRLTLRTLGPLFVGSGYKYYKHDYLFDPQRRTVSIIREEALFRWLVESGNLDAYEQFVLANKSKSPDRKPQDENLQILLDRLHISPQAREKLIRYTIGAGNVLDAGHSLKEISAFVRNGAGEAYVPGSSVKGALRTAILFREIRRCGSLPSKKRGTIPEESYLNVLEQNPRQRDNAINSLLRGLSVSDSAPIPDAQLTLARKVDVRTDSVQKTPNVLRECVRSGAELSFQLTLDRSILGGRLQASDILAAITDFFAYYRAKFNAHFPTVDASAPARGAHLFLGGGSGFFSKTVVYPYLGYDRALQEVEQMMQRSFRKHHHEWDASEHGISPHMLKYGQTAQELHEFGLCEVKLD